MSKHAASGVLRSQVFRQLSDRHVTFGHFEFLLSVFRDLRSFGSFRQSVVISFSEISTISRHSSERQTNLLQIREKGMGIAGNNKIRKVFIGLRILTGRYDLDIKCDDEYFARHAQTQFDFFSQ